MYAYSTTYSHAHNINSMHRFIACLRGAGADSTTPPSGSEGGSGEGGSGEGGSGEGGSCDRVAARRLSHPSAPSYRRKKGRKQRRSNELPPGPPEPAGASSSTNPTDSLGVGVMPNLQSTAGPELVFALERLSSQIKEV